MTSTKNKLRAGQPVFGAWTLTGHAAIVEIMAGEGFDFVCVDMEHTPTSRSDFYHAALATKGTGCDILARLPSCDADLAKHAWRVALRRGFMWCRWIRRKCAVALTKDSVFSHAVSTHSSSVKDAAACSLPARPLKSEAGQ